MKIFIIVDDLSDSETSRVIVGDEHEFRHRGIDITIVSLHPEDQARTISKRLDYPERSLRCVPVKNFFDLGGWWVLLKFLKESKPDMVICYPRSGNSIGRIAAWLASASKIIAFEEGRVSSFHQVLQYMSDKVVATSDAEAKAFRHYSISSRKIALLENSLDPSMYKKDAETRWKEKFGISPDSFVFLYYGPLDKDSGVDVLLRALAKVGQGSLLVMGDGPERKELENLVVRLLIAGRVFFFLEPKNMLEAFAMSNCLVIPSRVNGSNELIIPSFASGLPVIVTDFPLYRDLVYHGKNGFIVKSQDSAEMALYMQRMVLEPELVKILKANTVVGLEKFSLSAHADQMLELAKERGSVVARFYRFCRFAAFIVVSLLVELAIAYVLKEYAKFTYMASVNIGFGFVAVFGFSTLKFTVFRSEQKMKMLWQIPVFLLASAFLVALLSIILYFAVERMGVWYMTALAVSFVIVSFPMFAFCKAIFRNE